MKKLPGFREWAEAKDQNENVVKRGLVGLGRLATDPGSLGGPLISGLGAAGGAMAGLPLGPAGAVAGGVLGNYIGRKSYRKLHKLLGGGEGSDFGDNSVDLWNYFFGDNDLGKKGYNKRFGTAFSNVSGQKADKYY